MRKAIRTAKTSYYELQFKNYRRDSRKTWGVVQTILNRKKVVNGFPDSFKVGENHISDEFPIAEGFNHFFANIGSELSANIPCPSNKSFNDFLTGTTPCTFSFDPCTPSDILKIISKLPSKNSAGHDD